MYPTTTANACVSSVTSFMQAYNNYHIKKKRLQLLQSMDIFKDVEP